MLHSFDSLHTFVHVLQMCCQSVSFINERGQKHEGVKGVVGGGLVFNFPLGQRELCRYTAIEVKQGKEKQTNK